MSQYAEASMTSKLSLNHKQEAAIEFIYDNDATLLVAPTGEGKTTICLHAIRMFFEAQEITQCIVACPASVISHWPTENIKWGIGLDVKAVAGTPKERLLTLAGKPQVIVVSLNNLEWLLAQGVGAEMIIVDELSKAAGKQTAKLRNKKWKDQIIYRVGMTATPVAENFEKLFGMTRVIDNGDRFGRSKEKFLETYFHPTDYKGYNHALDAGADKLLLDKIADIIHVIPSDKHLTLPPVTEHYHTFVMSDRARITYTDMKRDMLANVDGGVITSANRAVVSGKLRQISSGFIIDEEGDVTEIDDLRAQAVAALADGAVVVLYTNDHQRDQLARHFRHNAVYVYGGSDKASAIEAFKKGAVDTLIAQENTLSHGVDGLQHVCSKLIFMQPPWSADTKIQAIGRLHRTGQTKPVQVHTIMCEDSIDQLVEDRQDTKAEHMVKFMAHLKG